jgi:hypothetical protein
MDDPDLALGMGASSALQQALAAVLPVELREADGGDASRASLKPEGRTQP